MSSAANQPEPSLNNSEIHLALLAWKHDDITMIELKKVLEAHEEAAVKQAWLDQTLLLKGAEERFGKINWDYAISGLQSDPSKRVCAIKPRLTHPQAGEGEGK